MNGNVKIQFWDGQNWVGVDGIVNWSMSSDYFKEGRPVPSYVAPITTTDTWNGFQQDVQIILHDSYYLEFWVKESEIQKLAQMKSCDTVIITDLTNNVKHVVDMQTSDWFDFQEPEQISPTTNFKVSFIYRTNKKTVNKFDALSNLVTIIGSGTYYSKYAKVTFKSPLEEVKVPWSDGNVLIESTLRTGYQVLLYLSDSELETFKNDYYSNSLTIDGTAVEEVQQLEENALGEDNYRVVATFITDITSINQTPAANVVDLLTGTTHYYSHFATLPYVGELEETKILWGEDGDKLLSERNRIGFRILYYFTSSEFETFKNDWNQDLFTIDAATILEKITLEPTQLESGNYQVIVSCVTEIDTVNKTTGLATADTLQVNSNPYVTGFDKITINEVAEQITFLWPDGSNRLLREINKIGYKFLFYFNELGKETFKNEFNLYPAVVLPSSSVIEKRELEITEDTTGFYQIIASVVTSVAKNTYDLDPLNTHTLIITDSGSFTFYTDYISEEDVNDTIKDPFSNEDGLPVDSKTIDQQVTNAKFFLNTADKNSLKLHYERGTATIDAAPILYRSIVETTELGTDLWEVNISDLTTLPVPNYPL